MNSSFHLSKKTINFRSFHIVNSQGKLVCKNQGKGCGLLLVSLQGLSESKNTNYLPEFDLTGNVE